MKLIRLAAWTLWFTFCAISYAHAGPVVAAIGALLNATGVLGFLVKTGLMVALQFGKSLLMRGQEKKQAQPGISGQMKVGGDNSFSFIVGSYATAGSLDYVGTWGKAGKTPNAFLTQVVTVSDLRQSGLSSRIFINNERCTIDLEATVTPQGYPVKEYRRDGVDYLWVKMLDGYQTSAEPLLMSAFGSAGARAWAEDMIGFGSSVVLMTVRYNRELFTSFPVGRYEPGSIPLYDPRKDTSVGGSGSQRWGQPSTYAPSDNNIVIVYNIFRGIYSGGERIYGPGISAPRLPLGSWFTAMNECDVPIAIKGGGTEPQFRAGYEIAVAEHQPADVIDELLKACNGQIAEIGGVYKVRVGPPGLPVMFLTDEDFVITDPQELDPFKGLESTFNGATASYPDPAAAWEMKDAPQRLFSNLEAEDDDRRLLANFQFNAVSWPRQVQRLMKAMILDGRRMRSHRGTLPPVAFGLEPLDVYSWMSARNGYESKLFDIRSKDEMANVNQSIASVEVDPNDYDWTANTDELPWIVGDLDPRWPDPVFMSGWVVLPSSINDAGGRPRRPSIDAFCDGDMDGIRAVQVQVRNAANDVVFDGEAPYSDTPSETQSFRLSGGWCLPLQAYTVRGRFLPFSGIGKRWSPWLPVTTLDIRLGDDDVYLEGMIEGIIEFVNDATDWLDATRDLVNDSYKIAMLAVEQDAAQYTDRQYSEQLVRSATGKITASYLRAILAATGPGSALVGRVELLEATIPGLATVQITDALTARIDQTDAGVVALGQALTAVNVSLGTKASTESVILLSGKIEDIDGEVSALADAVIGVSAAADGDDVATARIRFTVSTGPTGYAARAGVQVRATGKDGWRAASAFWDVPNNPSLPTRFVVLADQFVVASGNNMKNPFVFQDGVARLNVANIGTINAGIIKSFDGKMIIDLNAGSFEIWS